MNKQEVIELLESRYKERQFKGYLKSLYFGYIILTVGGMILGIVSVWDEDLFHIIIAFTFIIIGLICRIVQCVYTELEELEQKIVKLEAKK